MNIRTLCFLLAVAGLSSCIVPDTLSEHREFVRETVHQNPQISAGFVEQSDFRLHYRHVGNPETGIAIWIHGTPGGWSDIARLFDAPEFNRQIMLVSIDRPGWGQSQYQSDPRIVTGFSEQGRLIAPLLKQLKDEYPDKPLLLAGHSWGGSLVPAIALDYPEYVDGGLVFAGGLNPELVKPRWYNKLGSLSLVNAMIGEGMRAANLEVYALAPELLAIADRWQELKVPMLVVQGQSDVLVDPANADFAESVLDPARSRVVRLENQGHLLQIERTNLIATCILAMANDDLDACAE